MRWAFRIVLALLLVTVGILAGSLIRGKAGTTEVDAPVTSTAPRNPAITTGCLAVPEVDQELSQAGSGGHMTDIPTDMASPWHRVAALEMAGGPMSQDARGFIQAWSAGVATDQESAASAALSIVGTECETMGYSTGP